MTSNPVQLRLFDIQAESTAVGYVYALWLGGLIKIGWTGRDVFVRANELGGEVLAYAFGSREDEARYHQRLALYRIGRTEDFYPTRAVMSTVEELVRAQPDYAYNPNRYTLT